MKELCLSVLALAILSGCSSIRSGLEIDAGDTFVLGGDQRGAFFVEVVNTGVATVLISEVTASADTLAVVTLDPRESASARFQPGSAALIANPDSREASLDVRVTGDTNLGMRYVGQ
ncbi:MAG: hypothetical protein AAF170_05825 [Bacteroidota bacterium]